MLKRLHAVGAWLAVALGAVHVAFTAFAYERFSLGAFWFVGSGFAIVYAGFVNLMLSRGGWADSLSRRLCYLVNVLTAALFGVGVLIIGEPQVFFGLFLFSFELAAAALVARREGGVRGDSGGAR